MAYGKAKKIENTLPKMGSAFEYYFLKVASGPAEWQEEYWLVTSHEVEKFKARGLSYPRVFDSRRGRLKSVDDKYGTDGVRVLMPGADSEDLWILTQSDIERIRYRVDENKEDIELHRVSWLADLFD